MTDLQRVKDLYAIICNGELPDSRIQERANIIQELERITNRNFRTTAEFHHLIADYIKKTEGKRLTTGEQVRRKRRGMKWTQANLADHLNVTKRTIINYESNFTPPTKQLLEWLNVDNGHMGKSEIDPNTTRIPTLEANSYGEK